jgi:hypothetical protein
VTQLIHHDFPRDADSSANGGLDDGPDDDVIMTGLEKRAEESKAVEENEVKLK